ncbi:MAG: citramalate synthase [Bacillota bacterium]
MKIFIYDTTLRDGSQGEGISFSVEDKLKIATKLELLGVDYIEGGWPGSNPKDLEFFRRARELRLSRAKMVAFGSTRRPGVTAEEDANLAMLLEAGTPTAALVGKSWDFHVTTALNVTLQENLDMIGDSIRYLREQGMEVLYDAEHFFDGYKHNPEYALATLRAAQGAGASWLVLCDTNGGSLPSEIQEIVTGVSGELDARIAIHTHNDSELAVANSLVAVTAGARMVQGTINGYGERCGNANLCSVIPNLELKGEYRCLPEGSLNLLTEISRYVSEIANVAQHNNQPFVGASAFAHKGGIHVSALMKDTGTYEHMAPESVGNKRRVLVSELSGMSNLIHKAREFQMEIPAQGPQSRKLTDTIKELEYQGYSYEGAEASLELVLRKALGTYRQHFQLESFKIIVEKRAGNETVSEAVIKIRLDDRTVHTAAEGDGPVNALDNALRKALEEFYPVIREMHLMDYKVRVLDEKDGTGAKVRVLIESRDMTSSWSTVGVSENIIEASWQALLDSMDYALLKQSKTKASAQEDFI